jgi:hypothetical protein
MVATQIRRFLAYHFSKTVRVGCERCDCDSENAITEAALARLESKGWTGIEEYQSFEASCKTYPNPDDAPRGFSVLDWYTHLGLCPDCAREDGQ